MWSIQFPSGCHLTPTTHSSSYYYFIIIINDNNNDSNCWIKALLVWPELHIRLHLKNHRDITNKSTFQFHYSGSRDPWMMGAIALLLLLMVLLTSEVFPSARDVKRLQRQRGFDSSRCLLGTKPKQCCGKAGRQLSGLSCWMSTQRKI